MPALLLNTISLANTFSEWVTVTNDLVDGFNGFEFVDFEKPSGTLYLNDPTLGLSVSNNSIFHGTLEVAGTGSNLLVRKNAEIQGTLNLSNTDGNALVLTANGVANVNYLNIVGTGDALYVANNVTIGGVLTANITTLDELTAGIINVTTLNNHYVNSSFYQANTAASFANSAYDHANAAFDMANSDPGFANAAFERANSSYNHANSAYNEANSAYDLAQGSFDLANTALITSGGTLTGTLFGIDASFSGSVSVGGDFEIYGATIYSTDTFTLNANTTGPNRDAYYTSYRPDSSSNSEIKWNESVLSWQVKDVDNLDVSTAYANLVTSNTTSSTTKAGIVQLTDSVSSTSTTTASTPNSVKNAYDYTTNVYAYANTGYTQANNAASFANGAFVKANSAGSFANGAFTAANSAASFANGAFTAANTKFSSSGGTVSGDVTVTGNLTINGTTTTVNTQTVDVTDSLIKLAKNNTSGDAIDIGFYGPYETGGFTRYTGLFRKAADKFYLVQGVTTDPSGNTVSFTSLNRSTLDTNITGGSVSGLSAAIAIADGGTGGTSAASALTNLLPTGTNAGYVLTTGGPGSFYWAAAGAGGGVAAGTTINSSRLTYTANGTGQAYTTPTYTPGASQLRVYFDGVRQFASEYTETSSTVVTFSSAVPSGVVILVEVDGYINNPYYANNIAFTVNSDISATANTIQLAIDGLTSKLVTNYANTLQTTATTFNGKVLTPTAATGTSNTMLATTAFVNNTANAGYTFTASVTGNAGTVTNGVYNNGGSYNINITGTATTSNNITAYSINQNLSTTSNTEFASVGVGTVPSGVLGEIVATNNITAYYSDERLKTKLGNIENALDKIDQLSGFYHEANETAQSLGYQKVREVGVSAQEVEKVLPEVVAPAPIDHKYLTVRYERLVPLLIEGIKELRKELNELKNNKEL